MMWDEEIVEKVCEYGWKRVILRGGEGGVWVDEDLIGGLDKGGK